MNKQILITGGTGFIGNKLIDTLLVDGHRIAVLTRRPQWVNSRWHGKVQAIAEFSELDVKVDWLINLAGEGIADARWSQKRKQALRDSRIALTERLARWAELTDQAFEVVLSGSAIGYYGGVPGAHPVFSENSPAGNDFSANLCIDWEAAAKALESRTQRLVLLRTGIVLDAHDGMLQRLWLPFKLGLGGVIGSGDQVTSWIHRSDYCRAIHFLLGSTIVGPVNMTAPYAASNREFTAALASALHRPAVFPMPAFAAKLVFGELSELLLKGQNVKPNTLTQAGFDFQYLNVSQALEEIVRAW